MTFNPCKPSFRGGLHRWIILISTLMLRVTSVEAAQIIPLPLGHWAYDLLDRLDARGLFKLVGYDAKPLTRGEVVQVIRQVSNRTESMTSVDLALFEALKGEFADELENEEISISPNEREPHLLSIGIPEKRLFIDGRLDHRTERIVARNNRWQHRSIMGFRARGRYKNIIAFTGEAQFRNVDGVGPADVTTGRSRGLLSSIDERDAHAVEFLGSVAFGYRWFQFYVGKDVNRWGPALRSFPIVSDLAPPYPMIKAIFTLWGLKYTYFHGFLVNDGSDHIPNHPLNLPQKRYWAGQRLDFNPWSWLRFGAMETIVYGHRNPEPLYFFPVTTFTLAEPLLDGDDKRNIAFDTAIRVRRNIQLYGHLLISDWWIEEFNRFIRIFSDSSARWNIAGGLWWLDPFGGENTDFRIEYNRIEPFVHTQRFPWNVYQYRLGHLGTYLEPNSDNIFFEWRYRPGRDWQLSAHAQMTRHSDTPVDGIGDGSIYGVEDVGLGTRKKDFLGGVMERTLSGGFRVRREVLRRQFVVFHYTFVRVRPVDFTNQIPLAITRDHRLMLNISLDY